MLRRKIKPRIRSLIETYMNSRGYEGSIELVDTMEGFDIHLVAGRKVFIDSIRLTVKPLKVGEEYLLRSPIDYTRILRKIDEIISNQQA